MRVVKDTDKSTHVGIKCNNGWSNWFKLDTVTHIEYSEEDRSASISTIFDDMSKMYFKDVKCVRFIG